jgi:hypothetical protein
LIVATGDECIISDLRSSNYQVLSKGDDCVPKKSNTEAYTILPRRTIRDKELNELSVHSRWLYVVLCSEWDRSNPDKSFMLTYSQIREITNFEDHRISACLKELIKHGFIERNSLGGLFKNPNTYKINEYHLKLGQNPKITQYKQEHKENVPKKLTILK